MTTEHPQIHKSTGDPYLDMLAVAIANWFRDAEHNLAVRQEIVATFDINTLTMLHMLSCIHWDPRAVPTKLALLEE